MSLEISSVTGQQSIGGITQPIIGQRRIDHETRLADGDVNLLGGILEDQETQSLSGYPWISKLPILKYLFAQENKERRENEIVFAITPHIVRSRDVTEDDLRVVEVGTGSLTELRRNPAAPAASATEPADAAKQKAAPQGAPPTVPTPVSQRPTNPPAQAASSQVRPPARLRTISLAPSSRSNPIAFQAISFQPPPAGMGDGRVSHERAGGFRYQVSPRVDHEISVQDFARTDSRARAPPAEADLSSQGDGDQYAVRWQQIRSTCWCRRRRIWRQPSWCSI